ncbi:MAG: sigma-54-dependent Fis family transcriptional regulator [Deltaproteobacteria bacterium]|nr:sigma-54-dependent Fis family transcriptional regulator [Deltaproteobacteria bacterium]
MWRHSVLVVDDEELICWSLQKDLTKLGYSVTTASTAAEAVRAHQADPADVVLLDIALPDASGLSIIEELHRTREDTSIVMITSNTTLETAVEAVRLGAWDYLTKPFDYAKLHNVVAKAAERVGLRQENRVLRARDRNAATPTIVAESLAMKTVLDLASRVAASDGATVLLLGESGVGKDLVARHIHADSARSGRLFLDVNCAAMPEALLESELFGHERGAFTDAKTQKPGLFELAAGGTVFLDEIADAPPLVQAKLLKVIEQRTFRRVGGVRDLPADVRVIAATNRNLEQAVAAHTFREDLYYRLKVFPITIPPLCERRADILPLARMLLEGFARAFRKPVVGFDAESEQRLVDYAWPGNVRELRNAIERAMILVRAEDHIGLDLLPAEIAEAVLGDHPSQVGPSGALADAEGRLIREALKSSGGNQSRAAALLGISRGALARRMHRLGIGLDDA